MRLTYAWELGGDAALEPTLSVSLEEKESVDEADAQYIEQVLQGIVERQCEIDQKIESQANGWRLERIGKVDLAILRLAIFEMMCREDVPDSVAINEAVELAKRYGAEKSSKFVNGVLGGLARSGACRQVTK